MNAPVFPIRLPIDPGGLFVPSGLIVAPGERYRFTANGQWRDWFKVCDADGWRCRALQWGNRLPGVPFFKLCGCVGTDLAQAFAIGSRLDDWAVPAETAGLADRQLYFFANDWAGMYGNNHALDAQDGGPLVVEITLIE